jgi:hypothetical protein
MVALFFGIIGKVVLLRLPLYLYMRMATFIIFVRIALFGNLVVCSITHSEH